MLSFVFYFVGNESYMQSNLIEAKYREIMSWRLAFLLASAAATMSSGTSSSSMSSLKSRYRCVRAKLYNTAVATIMTRIFAKGV